MPDLSNPISASSLEHDKDLFRLLLEFKDYAIAMLDCQGRIKTWNLGAEHIYGYPLSEASGQLYSFLVTSVPAEEADPMAFLIETVKKGKAETEGWLQRKDGKAFYANSIFTPLYAEDDSLRGYAMVTRDITVQKRLEEENEVLHEKLEEKVAQRTEELAVVNKELEAFSYSVSHDLRTPLRAISGYSMILQEDYADKLDAEGNRIIDTITRNTAMMGQLIDDLLSFSRMGRLKVIYEDVSMERLVKEVLGDLLQHETKAYKIEVAQLPTCKGDPSMLKQVWANLVGNAIKYSSKVESPEISIGSRKEGAFQVYYITDNGAGFDMKYADKLFGVFQRLHRMDEFEGTGLGLALAKRIVSKHGGEIRGEGDPEKGATFYFSLPL
ncbi:MAG: cph1 5 [Flaviaesturariibacter sp.]|nr:cph1 5 [Flaviaesturariibacter sp.]